jgi:hypothetical protein
MVTTRTKYFNLEICPFSLQDVFNIVTITTNRVNSDYFVTKIHDEEEEEEKKREKEIRSRDVVRGATLAINGEEPEKNSLFSRIPGSSRLSFWLR